MTLLLEQTTAIQKVDPYWHSTLHKIFLMSRNVEKLKTFSKFFLAFLFVISFSTKEDSNNKIVKHQPAQHNIGWCNLGSMQ